MLMASSIWWSRAGALSPPRRRLHDEPFAGDLDRPQLGRPHHAVVVLRRRPALDAPANLGVEDARGIGVDEPPFGVASRRTTRRPTGEAPEPLHQSAEVGVGARLAHVDERDGRRPCRRSAPQRRTHPPHV